MARYRYRGSRRRAGRTTFRRKRGRRSFRRYRVSRGGIRL